MEHAGSCYPQELLEVKDHVEKLLKQQVAPLICKKVAPQLSAEQVLAVVSEVWDSLMAASTSESMDLKLEFTHVCESVACNVADCKLCKCNPQRRCERHLARKYLVGDALKAKCGAKLLVQLVNQQQQKQTTEIPDACIEVCLIDGNLYKDRGGDIGCLSEEDLAACFKLKTENTTWDRQDSLLQSKLCGCHQGKIVLSLKNGIAELPDDLQVTDGSENVMTGKKPPFRLLVRAAYKDGRPFPGIQYACSEDFVVASRRVKQADKAEIPLMDDDVTKIDHIGKETCKKLKNLDQAAAAAKVLLHGFPPNLTKNITTVRDLQALLKETEANKPLRKSLQAVLKLPDDKWEEVEEHLAKAVERDQNMRMWRCPGEAGLAMLFNARDGKVMFKEVVGILRQDGSIAPAQELSTEHTNILSELKKQAMHAWNQPLHPGWDIYSEARVTASNANAWSQPAQPARPAQPAPHPQMQLAPQPAQWPTQQEWPVKQEGGPSYSLQSMHAPSSRSMAAHARPSMHLVDGRDGTIILQAMPSMQPMHSREAAPMQAMHSRETAPTQTVPSKESAQVHGRDDPSHDGALNRLVKRTRHEFGDSYVASMAEQHLAPPVNASFQQQPARSRCSPTGSDECSSHPDHCNAAAPPPAPEPPRHVLVAYPPPLMCYSSYGTETIDAAWQPSVRQWGQPLPVQISTNSSCTVAPPGTVLVAASPHMFPVPAGYELHVAPLHGSHPYQ